MYILNSTGSLMLQTMLYLANQSSKAITTSLYDLPPAAKSDVNDVKCYGVYGCFPLSGPWLSNNRQINVHPQKPSEIQPHFTLYTTRSLDSPMFIDLNDPESLFDMGINPNGKIFLIAHGYLEAGDRPWMLEMGRLLLSNEPEGMASVILIDWGGGSSPPYVQAVANIRLVGTITAHVIHMIYEELQLPNLDKVHAIGHSLGAHLAGYTGHTLQRDFGLKMFRITGLDPAAPLFSETDAVVRLDRSDATFVDVIHTDANPLIKGGLGMVQRIGHVDFYPNGGFENPGCGMSLQDYMKNQDQSFFVNVQEFLGCNHIRSFQFFTESIHSKCPFRAITCEDFDSFKLGKCSNCGENGHSCIRMGYHSHADYVHLLGSREIEADVPLTAYLMAGDQKPFCRVHYKLSVRISGTAESNTHGGEIGTLSIRLHAGRKKSTDRMKFSESSMYFEPGFEYSSLLPGKDIQNPTYATVFWEYQTNLLNPLTWRILAAPRIYIDYILVESLENELHLKLCPLRNSPILSGSENVLQAKYCGEFLFVGL